MRVPLKKKTFSLERRTFDFALNEKEKWKTDVNFTSAWVSFHRKNFNQIKNTWDKKIETGFWDI